MSAHEYSQTLQQLIPLELTGVYVADLTLEGEALNQADIAIGTMADELLPQTTNALLAEWERLYVLQPSPAATLAERQTALLNKYRDLGGIHPPYFVATAVGMGFELTITEGEASPLMAGTGRAGQRLENYDNRFVWRAEIPGGFWRYLRSGAGRAGQPLRSIQPRDLVSFLDEYKPADSAIFYL